MFCPTFVLFGESMATFRKRNNGWQARIQRKGYPDLAKTFKTHTEAVNWAKEIEYQIYKGLFHLPIQTKEATLGELLIKYQQEITPLKKSIKPELYRIQAWLKSPYADRYVSNLRSSDFAAWRDLRIKQGKAGNTVKLELALISHLYFIARAEWGFEDLDNPIRHIRKPKLARGRTRRATDEEIRLIIENTDSSDLPFIVKLALETGMRRGEIASIRWSDINFEGRFIQLLDTKNGEDRKVPLSSRTISIIKSIPIRKDGMLFGMTAQAISYAFIRAKRRVGLEDLHFHDLRHEAISRMFEKSLNVMEVGAISGHKTLQMLKRYTHLNPKELALKLG
jgi:integrase